MVNGINVTYYYDSLCVSLEDIKRMDMTFHHQVKGGQSVLVSKVGRVISKKKDNLVSKLFRFHSPRVELKVKLS